MAVPNFYLTSTYKTQPSVADVFNRLSASQFVSLCPIGLTLYSPFVHNHPQNHEKVASNIVGCHVGRRDGAQLGLVIGSWKSRHRHERRIVQNETR